MVEGTGTLPHAQTMAFTTLMLFQIFNVINARSDERSAFNHLFTNRWLWTAVLVSVLLQILVVYVPFLQRAFGTVTLSSEDWLFCVAIASSVLWLREISKLVGRLARA
jgi:Ca2+-transporting ATPase